MGTAHPPPRSPSKYRQDHFRRNRPVRTRHLAFLIRSTDQPEVLSLPFQARGDALPDSDIDVMVVLRGNVNPLKEASRISRFRGDLCLRHNVVITCVYLSADEPGAEDSPLLQNIRAEGVAL